MAKKIIAILLAAVMIVCVFAGCTGGQKENSQQESSSGSKSDSSKESSSQASENSGEELPLINTDSLLPVVNEPLSLSVAVRVGADDLESDEKWFYRWWKDATGIDIEYIQINSDALSERKAVMLAGEDLPDVMYAFNWTNNEVLNYGMNEHFFAVLNDSIETYGDKIKEKMELCPGSLEGVTLPDGNIYSIPQLNAFPTTMAFSTQNTSINMQWIENLGLEKPVTLEDYYEVLKAFKEQDANGNGDPNDEIPWSGSWTENQTTIRNQILLAYGIVSDGGFGNPALKNGEVTYAPVDEDYFNYLTFMNRLYTEGLLDQDVFSQDNTAFTAKGNEMRVGVIPFAAPYYITGSENDNYTQYESFLLTADASKAPVAYQAYGFVPGYITIASSCENVDAAVRLINTLYDDTVNIMQFYGPMKGSEYDDEYAQELNFGYENVYDDNGNWINYNMPGYSEEEHGNLWSYLCRHCMCVAGNAFTGVLARVNLYNADPIANGNPLEATWRASNREFVLPYIQYGYPSVYLDDASLKTISEIATPLADYAYMMEAKFITGDEPLSNYDAYLEEMNNLGVQDYLKIYTEAYAK